MNLVKLKVTKLTHISLLHFFLYTNNKRSETEIQEVIPFTIASKRTKYPEINLPQETKDLYSKDYKMLIKGIKKDINRRKDRPCLWIERICIVKMTTLPKAI